MTTSLQHVKQNLLILPSKEMNNWHWLRVCGDRTQFCHMQGDLLERVLAVLGYFWVCWLSLGQNWAIVTIKRESHLKLGLQSTGMAKQWEVAQCKFVLQDQPVWGAGTHWIPAAGSCLSLGAAVPAVRPLALHSARSCWGWHRQPAKQTAIC